MDMNLIRTFVSVYQHQSYTRAAENLGLTQPAVSMAIKRLEAEVGTALFIKSGRSITPTHRAELLASELQRGIEIIDNAISAKTQHSVYCVEGLSHLIGDLDDTIFKVPPLDQELIFKDLRSQQVDLAIDTTTSKDSAFVMDLIHQETIKIICRKDHPRIVSQLTKEQFYQESHVVFKARREGRQFLDLFAKEALRPRREKQEVSTQANMALAVADSDHLGLVFGSFARKWENRLNLSVFDIPLECEQVPIHMVYHQRSINDPAHIKLRQKIIASFKLNQTSL
ncbi:LysR family transcriptional regulator [Photobacterium sanctipauli]|uniref:LysR family transcriptional regulator n=1 Tax=Photobacterium sanctipauli TaxID=1342794 RepID=A0A2T3NNV9_9GAMM|nr:LysR family transcriptional regulator [Photobacterium sanctipauli]PSW17649.1 LysR family transcriptional regulator [Photobacterium sanctipauli]